MAANARARLRRWHVWLGWLIAIPMLLWTISGVVMVWKPIEEVRGTGLIMDKGSIGGPVGVKLPKLEHWDFKSLTLESRAQGQQWVMRLADGGIILFDPRTGEELPPISAADAAREVAVRYTGKAKIASTSRMGQGDAPIEYRGDAPTWQVRMSDGTHFYVDARTGDVVARRTGWWRFYDFMWGLHIMDPGGREDTHNPFIIGFGIAALVSTLLAIILLPLVTKRRRKGRFPTVD